MQLSYVNKLQIIQLYKADFNTMLKKLLDMRLMEHINKHGLNGHLLFGSMRGKSTYDALITVRVIYYIART